MNIVSWVLLGLVAGVVANMLDPTHAKGGILGAVVLGILGALIGGIIANALFGLNITGFDLNSFVITILSSLLLLSLDDPSERYKKTVNLIL